LPRLIHFAEVIMSTHDDKIAELLGRLRSRVGGKADRSNCPDEERLVDFVAGHLEKRESATIEAHVADCSFCLDDLAAAYQSSEVDGIETVPKRLIDQALKVVQGQRETLFHLVVRLVRGSMELISTSARVTPAPTPVLRGEAKPAESNSLQVEHEVGRFRVAVELDLSAAGTCQVVANVKEQTGEPAEGVRLSLTSGDREQASFLTRAGIVVFDRIAPGEYGIAVSESGAVVGKIKLSLMM